MGVVAKKLDYDDFRDEPKSELSKQKFLTDPSKRAGSGPFNRSVGEAERLVASLDKKQ